MAWYQSKAYYEFLLRQDLIEKDYFEKALIFSNDSKQTYYRSLENINLRKSNEVLQKKHPIKTFFFVQLLDFIFDIPENIRQFFKFIKWFVLHRTTEVYHKIDTGLKPGYYEFDTRLLHGSFNMFKQYVDETYEGIFEPSRKAIEADWEDDAKEKKKRLKELLEIETLYDWWIIREYRQDPYDLYNEDGKSYEEKYGEVNKERERQYQEDTDMLIRLIKIRNDLW